MIPPDTPVGMDNCGIASIAMLAGVSYADTERLFITMCGRHDITDIWDRLEVAQALDLTVLEEKHYRLKPTLTGWLEVTYDPDYDYHVTLTGHVITLRNHKLYDPAHRLGISLSRSPYKRKRVSSHLKLGAIK
jgi:hypothetical protein